MTKLFSMKSLAFAGAAAFALTLAAAPQAEAADAGKPGMVFEQEKVYEPITKADYDKLSEQEKKSENVQSYWDSKKKETVYEQFKGKYKDAVDSDWAYVVVSRSAVTITDGKLDYYYSAVKTGSQPKKWKVASTTDWDRCYTYDENDNIIDLKSIQFTVPVQEIAKGKEKDIYIASDADAAFKVGPIKCKAAPKLKVSLNNLTSGPSITVKNKKSELTSGTVDFDSQYGGFYSSKVDVKDLKDGLDKSFMSSLQSVADFGGATLLVTYYSDDEMTPVATGKLKIAATPKAPKVALKLTKFKLNLKSTIAYRTLQKDANTTINKESYDKLLSKDEQNLYSEAGQGIYELKWTDGAKISDLKALFGSAHTTDTPVSGEYVLNDDMVIQAKTKAKGKKTDSKITTTTVYKSAATPTAINAVISKVMQTKKNASVTGVSIKFDTKDLTLSQSSSVSSGAVVTLQYLEKGGKKWKDVKGTSQEVKYKNGKVPEEVYVRVKAVDYKAANAKKSTKASYYEAPGRIMAIKIDFNDPEGLTKYTTTSASIYHTLSELKAIEEAEKKAAEKKS